MKLALIIVMAVAFVGCSRAEIKDFATDTAVDGTTRVIDKHAPTPVVE